MKNTSSLCSPCRVTASPTQLLHGWSTRRAHASRPASRNATSGWCRAERQSNVMDDQSQEWSRASRTSTTRGFAEPRPHLPVPRSGGRCVLVRHRRCLYQDPVLRAAVIHLRDVGSPAGSPQLQQQRLLGPADASFGVEQGRVGHADSVRTVMRTAGHSDPLTLQRLEQVDGEIGVDEQVRVERQHMGDAVGEIGDADRLVAAGSAVGRAVPARSSGSNRRPRRPLRPAV